MYDFTMERSRPVRQFLGCAFDECEDRYLEVYPVEHVDGDDPATFLWHDQADAVVTHRQAVEFQEALDDAAVGVTFQNPADAGHLDHLVDGRESTFREAEGELLSGQFDLPD